MTKLWKKQVWPLLTFTPDQNRIRLYLIRWWWVKKVISCPACAKNVNLIASYFKINKTQILKVSKYFYLNWYQATVYMYFPLKISNSQQVMQVRFIVSKSTLNKYFISHHIIDLYIGQEVNRSSVGTCNLVLIPHRVVSNVEVIQHFL